MLENVIIFGASALGEMTFIYYKNIRKILCFCDNDVNKHNTILNGLPIIAPEELIKFKDVKVIIASQYHREIAKQLSMLGITDFEKSPVGVVHEAEGMENFHITAVNLGDFLIKTKHLTFDNLTFINGGSGILDYAFLKSLMLNLNLSMYLEIGTFLGESIDAIHDVAEKCYSISLPNETLGSFMSEKGKKNFGRYFSYNKQNVIHFETDSKIFDYSLILDDIDLVFIDGDHSYQGIYIDTKRIFDFIRPEKTVVVWHDFKIGDFYRKDTVKAIFDAVPLTYQKNIYAVDNNMCAIYIPDKYLNEFSFDSDPGILFSYRTTIEPRTNYME